MKYLERIEKIVNDVEDGNMEPLKALVFLHEQQKQLEEAVKLIKAWKSEKLDDLRNAASDYPDGFMGCNFEFRSGGKTFVYDDIEPYSEAKKSLKEMESYYRAAYESLQKGQTPIDSETGEVIPVPSVKYRADSIIVKVKK